MSNIFCKKNKKFLCDFAEGETCEILSCDLPPEKKCRFFEMGLTPNAIVSIIKKAPAGDPTEIALRGYRLCVRNCDAKHFRAESCDERGHRCLSQCESKNNSSCGDDANLPPFRGDK